MRWTPDSDDETTLEWSVFATRYQNLVGTCTASSGCATSALDQEFAGGRARIAGAELLFAHRVTLAPGLWLPARATYALTDARFQTTFESDFPLYGSVERGDALPYVPAHQASLALGLEGWRWNVLAFGAGASSMREVAGQGRGGLRTDPTFHLDLAATYEIAYVGAGAFSVYLRADNLTGSRAIASRRPMGARPDKPFGLLGGLRWAIR